MANHIFPHNLRVVIGQCSHAFSISTFIISLYFFDHFSSLTALTIDILSRIFNVFSISGLVLTLLPGPYVSLHFFCYVSQIAFITNRFTSDKQFYKSDFQYFSWGVLVHVRWSKTIQFWDRKVCIPVSCIPNSHLCPVKAILHAFSFTRFSSDSEQTFAFMDVGTGSMKTFTCSTFLSHLRTCLSNIGIKPQQYAGHSFCHGGASLLT